MTLPSNWTLVTVTGTYINRNGQPAEGYVTFESPQPVVIGGTVIVPRNITAHLDANGHFTAQIPSTNDPDLSVTGWTYTVTEHVENGRPPYQIEVPYTVGALDLATVPVASPNPTVPSETLLHLSDVGTVVAPMSAVAGLGNLGSTSNGLIAHTGAGTWEVRTITSASGAALTVADGDGINGNPTLTVDATLVALAGQNWAANTLPIGSGADTVAQIAFAANTFPARGSTGSLVAKAISDASLSLLVDSAASGAAAFVGFLQSGSGAVARTLQAKGRDVVHASDFGVIADGTDQSAKLVNAYNELVARGGGVLTLPLGEICLSTGFVVSSHNIFMQGAGYQKHSNVNAGAANRWTQFGGTILKWIGSTGGGDTVLSFKPPVTGPALYGCGYDGIVIDCDAKASNGLEILSNQGGHFPRIMVGDALTRNIHIGVMPSGPWTSADPRDTQHTYFGQMFSRVWLASALGADGILIDGDDAADVSVCQFDEVFYIHKDATGLTIKSSDALEFGTVFGFRIAGGAVAGMRIDGGASVTDNPRRNHFNFVQPGPGGLTVAKNTVAPDNIVIDCYSLGNGTPSPVIGDGCGVTYRNDSGQERLSRTGAAVQRQDFRNNAAAADNIDLIEQRARNSAGTDTVYSYQQTNITDTTAGNEDAARYFFAKVSGADVEHFRYGAGGVNIMGGALLKRVLTGSASLDFPSVAANGGVQALTISVPGATTFDSVALGPPANGGTNGLIPYAYVSAADTVTVRLTNATAGALDPGAQTYRVTVFGF